MSKEKKYQRVHTLKAQRETQTYKTEKDMVSVVEAARSAAEHHITC